MDSKNQKEPRKERRSKKSFGRVNEQTIPTSDVRKRDPLGTNAIRKSTYVQRRKHMNRIFKSILCVLLVTTFCLSAMVGCKKSTDESAETTAAETQAAGGAQTNAPDVEPEETLNDADTLGDYDFGGAKFNILVGSPTLYEWDSDNATKQATVNNAVYTRNEQVKSRFNVELSWDEVGSWWPTNNDMTKNPWYAKYQKVVQSGWSEYQMATTRFDVTQCASVQGWCMDLSTLEEIDPMKEWWAEEYYNQCNIKGKYWVAIGDINYSMYENFFVFFLNETLAAEVLKDEAGEPVDLYDMVRDGEWTWEKLKTYSTLINDVGVAEADKRFTLISARGAVRAFGSAFELDYAESAEKNGYLIYSFPQNSPERTVTILDSMGEFFKGEAVNSTELDTTDATKNSVFAEGRALFMIGRLGEITNIAESMATGMEYGILPYPKYDTDQLDYHTSIFGGASCVTVPRNVENTEMTAVIIEALCMYSYQEIRPAYLDTVLAGRYLSDADLNDMMNTIRATATVTFFEAYGTAMGTPHVVSCTDTIIANRASTSKYGTYYANCQPQYAANLAKVYKAYGVIT